MKKIIDRRIDIQYVGNILGNKYEKRAELAGGVILILTGVKILLEHLGILVL